MIHVLAFYLFAALVIASGAFTILARNPVHSVLWLIMAFFNAAGLMVLVGAEFIAMLLVIVYVGAVAVLFLFVVMMLDINLDTMREGFWKHFPLAATLGALVALEMAAVLMSGFRMSQPVQAALAVGQAPVQVSNSKALGILLYTEYLMPIQVAAAILLVAMIAAIALTLRERKDSKAINPSEQVRVRASDRMVVLKMDVTQPGQAPQPPDVAGDAVAKEAK